jgi:hypothetical protein
MAVKQALLTSGITIGIKRNCPTMLEELKGTLCGGF